MRRTPGQACDEGGSHGAWSLAQVFSANFLLSNDSTPAASNIAGTLLSPGARGTVELALTASDPAGPGVYIVEAEVDGNTLYVATPDTNGGECAPVGTSTGALMFDYSQPCRQSESVDVPVETTSLHDGQHTLKITVEDAAQNKSIVFDGPISTHNAPAETTAPAILTPSQVYTGGELSTQPGTWSAPSAAGSISYTYQWQDCSTAASECQPVTGATNATYTPTPSDIGHTLRVQITAADNDGSTTATSAPTSTVLAPSGSLGAPNGPGTSNPGGTNPGSPGPGGGLTGTNPAGTMPGGLSAGSPGTLGQPNGNGASEAAQLRLGTRSTITRSYTRRSITIPGRLLNSQGQPISSARVEALQQTAGSSHTTIIAHASTHPDGSFNLHVPAGPSRSIQIAYRAYTGEQGYAAQAKVRETVTAGVQLRILTQYTTPTGVRLWIATHNTTPTGTILLSGRVLGQVPAHGVVVELLVHYLGHWVPFQTPRTNHTGHFSVEYQFQGAQGHFPFRAEVRGSQAGFPFSLGYSHPLNVTTS